MLHSLLFFFGIALLIFLSNTNLALNLSIFTLFLFASIFLNLPFLSVLKKIKYFIFALLIIFGLPPPFLIN